MGRDIRWDNVNAIAYEILEFLESSKGAPRETISEKVSSILDRAQREGEINTIERAKVLDVFEL